MCFNAACRVYQAKKKLKNVAEFIQLNQKKVCLVSAEKAPFFDLDPPSNRSPVIMKVLAIFKSSLMIMVLNVLLLDDKLAQIDYFTFTSRTYY